MLRPLLLPSLVLLQHGRPTETFALKEGTLQIGRAKDCDISLNDTSVSRQHAEVVVGPASVLLRDLKSRNGVQVNGVPRREASLQPDDRVRIGTVELLFKVGITRSPARPKDSIPKPDNLTETQHARAVLPDQRQDRHLAALYHLCYQVTDGVVPVNAEQQLLDLLLEGVRAKVAQFYSPDDTLSFSAASEKTKGTPKFAPYLLDKFRQVQEAIAYTSRDLARYQERLGEWHFLVAPMSIRADGPAAIIVLMRGSDWQEFSAEDRLLLNAATRLWNRGQRRGQEIANLRHENSTLRDKAAKASGLLGDTPVLQALRTRLDRIAQTKATVLVTGETGSGKEVVAQYVHDHSPRGKSRFIKVNCAAIPHTLMESELFGHVKGAFTDAKTDHQGKFQLADKGTLFLDEVGELPLAVQSKLLRVLETGEVERIGSEQTTKVDVRIVAATNRDLHSEVKNGNFREDLLYRLEVATVTVPPLREHLADIALLARLFLERFCEENGLANISLEAEALKILEAHSWPGNVRELRNVMQRIALEAAGPLIKSEEAKHALKR